MSDRDNEVGRFDEARMSFVEHLGELRTRLIRCLIAITIGVLACFTVAEYIYYWLLQPLIAALPPDRKAVHFLNPVEPFMVFLKVAVLAGIFAASPVCLYQLWRFVAPGLYPRERRAVVPFVASGTVFFIGGAAFCRYVVLPVGLETLMGVGSSSELFEMQPQITMAEYFSVATKLMLAFGAVFELPVIVLFLSYVRLISYRTLLRHWRGAIVVAFIVGAILTPPDVITQTMLAVPLMILYGLSIGVAYVFGPKVDADGSIIVEERS